MNKTLTSELSSLPRRTLANDAGLGYVDFRETLTPRWGVLWCRILAGHMAIVALMVAVAALGGGAAVNVALAVGGGVAMGYVLHYLVLFQHEAAHFNLAPSRRANDVLCDIFIGVFIGEGTAAYRTVHLDHHRYLGTVRDTEHSYFDALDARFALESVTGIRLLRVLRDRSQMRGDEGGSRLGFLNAVFVAAAIVNGTIVVGSLVAGEWPLAIAWSTAVLVWFPGFNSVRQLLEHRDAEADRTVDYKTVAHGPINRLFGGGPVGSTLGAAGFNRHLIHHWDPGVSCTRLAELERFLLGTSAETIVRENRTTYWATLRRLVTR